MARPNPRQRHWDDVYERRSDTEVSWFQPRPEVSLELIEAVGPSRGARVIDVGGGASRLVDHLVERGFRVTVLDVSPKALAASRDRLGAEAERVQWIEADITAWAGGGPFDLWHDRAVFHFLVDADERRRYLAALSAALEPGGHAIIATFGPDGPTRCSGLPVVRYSEGSLASELGEGFQLVDTRRELHTTPAGRTQAFVYCLFRASGQAAGPG